MNGLLFDSDVLIDILRNEQKTLLQLKSFVSQYEEFFCSAITIGEIFAGMFPDEEMVTRKLLDAITVIPVTAEIAEMGGTLKFKTKSHSLWLDDCLIAASSIKYDLALATKNVKHYPFKNLRVKKIS